MVQKVKILEYKEENINTEPSSRSLSVTELHTEMKELTTNLCDMTTYIENITGMTNNSASPSDNWFIEFRDNINFNGKKIKYGFLKLFITALFFKTGHSNYKLFSVYNFLL